jgi:lysine 6-dehydrogenase
MNVLILGAGMQARGAVHDLVASDAVTSVVVADRDPAALDALAASAGLGAKLPRVSLDANDPNALEAVVSRGFDVVLDLLPVPLAPAVAQAAVRAGAHLVNTNYPTPEMVALAPEAEGRNVAILPEMGMDPGIDLVLLGDAVRSLDKVTELLAYGSGIPEPGADDNPLRYKVSWTFEGVLRTYHRPARLVREGRVVEVGPGEQLLPEHVHEVEIEGLGSLEAYPTADVLGHVRELEIDVAGIRRAGRYSMRWPGHVAFWRPVIELGLLDDEPVVVDGREVDRRGFLAAALEPRLRYAGGERDLAILRIEVAGERDGRRQRIVHEVIDRMDLDTGLSAMSRLVGFTAGTAVEMLGTGVITKRGLLSPTVDVPCAPFLDALTRKGITVRSETRAE